MLLRILLAFLVSLILGIIAVTGSFLYFGAGTFAQMGHQFNLIVTNYLFWLGIGIFSLLFFALFALPFTLIFGKE